MGDARAAPQVSDQDTPKCFDMLCGGKEMAHSGGVTMEFRIWWWWRGCLVGEKEKTKGSRSLVKETEDSGGSVVSEKFTEEVANLWVPKDDQKKRRFSMKDMGDVDVILGIRIEHESNGITISQSYYIEKVLKKFNYFDCTSVSTPMDTSEKLMPNNGQAVSQLKYSNLTQPDSTSDELVIAEMAKFGISAMVIENKVKTLSITTFLLLAKKVFRVTAFPEYYSSSSNHPIIVPSDSDIEDAFSSTNVPDYFPATPGNTSPDSSNDLTSNLLATLVFSPYYE
ncbi:zinc finger, CCHC-type containing protein [Tanacetum coccineum]